ncbi:MAG: hypothetical protein ACKPFK_30075 [Dolichospermum sp.]
MAKVKLNQETVFQYDGVVLFPEWNSVSKEDLEKLKTATLSIELGILEFEAEEAEKAEKAPKK